jgi:phytoene synthase
MTETLDALVRRLDEDRWLAARFASQAVRARLIAIYAAYIEIAKTAEVVTEEGLGAIRLQFWRDGVEAIYAGAAIPNHPVLAALSEAVRAADLPRSLLDALIDAREKDFAQAPFETWAELDAYVDATAGAVVELAARACDPEQALSAERRAIVRAAGRAWGFIGLARAEAVWTARNRTFLPKQLRDHVGLELAEALGARGGHVRVAAERAILDRGLGALRECRAVASALPPSMFPAIAYVSFAEDYARALMRADRRHTPLGPLARRFKLIQATMSGSL